MVRSDYIGPPVGFHGRPRGVTWLLLDDGTKVTVWADSPGYGAMWVGDGVDVVAAREFLEGVGVPLVAEDEGLD